ncbi:hypothetical protein [Falsirhodobacter sp. 1013]|uniref:hypothetical protein n=1 Tax=Falsirhodobacter sp. 1013 TaxID=3417566 RepID=UPI003EB8B65B
MVAELRQHFPGLSDGPSDKVRKEHDKEAIAQEFTIGDRSVISDNQIRDLLEREEGQGQRKDECRNGDVHSGNVADRLRQKSGIFEDRKKQDVRGDSEHKKGAIGPSHQKATQGVIEQNAANDQRQIVPRPPAVKDQRRHYQPQDGTTLKVHEMKKKEAQEYDGKKLKEEFR